MGITHLDCVTRVLPEKLVHKNVHTDACLNYGYEKYSLQQFLLVLLTYQKKRVCIAKSPEELDELDNACADIFKSNIIERHTLRPQRILSVDKLCLAEFVAYYNKKYSKDYQETAGSQPEVLTDDVIELHHNCGPDTSPPEKIRLMNTNEVMKCRKVKAVIRYHKSNKTKEPELYFHHLLMLYFPWRDETSLLGRQVVKHMLLNSMNIK